MKKSGKEGKPGTVTDSAYISGTRTTRMGRLAIVGMRNSRDACNSEETKNERDNSEIVLVTTGLPATAGMLCSKNRDASNNRDVGNNMDASNRKNASNSRDVRNGWDASNKRYANMQIIVR
jgi:hypothetical protein